MGSNASSLPGLVALLVTALLGAVQLWWKSQAEKEKEERKAARDKEKEAHEAREREDRERREREAREAREDREEISRRLRTLETGRQEQQVELAERRVELATVTSGLARLEGKLDKVLDAVIGHSRSGQ